jgi:hypothetical protein
MRKNLPALDKRHAVTILVSNVKYSFNIIAKIMSEISDYMQI